MAVRSGDLPITRPLAVTAIRRGHQAREGALAARPTTLNQVDMTPTSLDNRRRSPKKLLRAVVARILGALDEVFSRRRGLEHCAESLVAWARQA